MKFAIVASLFALTQAADIGATPKACTKIADCAAETTNKCCADFTGKDAAGTALTAVKYCAAADADTYTDASANKMTAKCMVATATKDATFAKVGAATVAVAAYYLA